MKKDMDIVVVGDSNVDVIISGLDSLPVLGTEKLATGFDIVMGGSSTIFACGAAKLGLKTGFIGKLGDDGYGKIVMSTLKKYKVDTSAIVIDPKIKTGVTISLTYPNDRAFLTYLGSISDFKLNDIDYNYINRARHMHLSAFFLQTGLQRDVPNLFKRVKKMGLTTSFDTGFDPEEKWDSGVYNVLKNTDIFLPNEIESTALSKKSEPEAALDALVKYVNIAAIKLGSKGSIAMDNKMNKVNRNSHKIKVVDTTGAGDSFNAGFIYGFLNGKDIGACLEYGNACGALSAMRIGGATSCPSISEVKLFMNSSK